jgi:hypothetical protein
MRTKTRLDDLEADVYILTKKVEMLAEMFKDYVDTEQSLRLDAGKWYPEAIDTTV